MRYLMPLDILAIITASLLAFLMRLGLPKYYELSSAALDMVFISLVVKIPIFFFMGLYQRPATWKPLEMLRNIFLGVIMSSAAVIILTLVGSALNIFPSIPRVAMLTDSALTLIALILIRAMAFGLRGAYASLKVYSPLEYFKQHWQQWIKEASIFTES